MKNANYVEKKILENRTSAGKKLYFKYKKIFCGDVIIVAIPNGGVEVANKIAYMSKKQIYIVPVRKIPLPNMPIIGLGAISQNNIIVNKSRVDLLEITPEDIKKSIIYAREKVEKDERMYKNYLANCNIVFGKRVLLIDDGVSSGFTMKVAIKEISAFKPSKIEIVTPIINSDAMAELKSKYKVRGLYLYKSNEKKFVVDDYYNDFSDINQKRVLNILKESEINR